MAETIAGVKDGTCPPTQAGSIAKLAGRLNETFFAEATVMRLQKDLDQEVGKLGQTVLD